MKYERQTASPEAAAVIHKLTIDAFCKFGRGHGFILLPELVGVDLTAAAGTDWPIFLPTALGNLSVPGAFPVKVEVYRQNRVSETLFIDRVQAVRFSHPFDELRVYTLMPWADHMVYALERWGCWLLEHPADGSDFVRPGRQFRLLIRKTISAPVGGLPVAGTGFPLQPSMASLQFNFFNGPRASPNTQPGEKVSVWWQAQQITATGGLAAPVKVDEIDSSGTEQVATRAVYSGGGVLWLTSPSGANDVEISSSLEV